MMLDGGLILEGGGMRGLYTVGVLDFFMKKDIYFKDCIGVSAGASHGCSYLSRQPKRARKIVMRYLDTKQYASPTAMILTGDFFDKKFHTQTVPDHLVPYDYETAAQNPMNFYVVATECETGQPVYHKCSDMKKDMEWVWASGCLPMFARTVEIEGRHYLDGAVGDSIPVRHSVEMGNRKNVVVLTRDENYRKTPDKSIHMIRMKYHKYPEFVKVMENRPEAYNDTLEYIRQEEAAGRLFVIRPKTPVTVGRLEKNKEALKALYRSGYEDARDAYQAMLAFMQEESSIQ